MNVSKKNGRHRYRQNDKKSSKIKKGGNDKKTQSNVKRYKNITEESVLQSYLKLTEEEENCKNLSSMCENPLEDTKVINAVIDVKELENSVCDTFSTSILEKDSNNEVKEFELNRLFKELKSSSKKDSDSSNSSTSMYLNVDDESLNSDTENNFSDEREIVNINPKELSQMVESYLVHEKETYLLIDTRFPYEYDDGHILFSKNMWEPIHLIRSLFLNDSSKEFEIDDDIDVTLDAIFTACMDTEVIHKKVILYDENDINRARQMADLIITIDCYLKYKSNNPKKRYQSLKVLKGGYVEFFADYSKLCNPQSITEKIRKRGFTVDSETNEADTLCSWRVSPAMIKLMGKLDARLYEIHNCSVKNQLLSIADYINKQFD